MKKLILTTIATVFALASFSQAWLKGGNNPSANPFSLESNSNDAIFFKTNDIQRMYIANGGVTNGFVGIGSNFSTPFSLLHINGINNNTGNLFQTTSDENLINRWVMSVEGGDPPPERFYIENPGGTAATTYNIDMGVVKNGDLNFS